MTDAPPSTFPRTVAARLARRRLDRSLSGFGDDVALWHKVQERVPAAWATVEEDIDCEEEKVKVTLRLDASVAKCFRAMGRGYQGRINRILATWVQMKIGEVRREVSLDEMRRDFDERRLELLAAREEAAQKLAEAGIDEAFIAELMEVTAFAEETEPGEALRRAAELGRG